MLFLVLCLGQCHQDCPDKATQFSSDRGDGNMAVLALIKAKELFG